MIMRTITIWIVLTAAALGVDLDGVNDYVSLGTNDFVGSGDYTLSFWYKTSESTSQMVLLESWSSGGIVVAVNRNGVTQTSGWISFIGSSTSIDDVSANIGSSLYDGNWHHIVVTRSGTTGEIWFDGASQASAATLSSGSHLKSVAANLGANTSGTGLLLDGQIVDGRIYDGQIVSDAEITSLMRGLNQLPATTMQLLMNESSGSDLTHLDISGNGNDGTGTNGAAGIADSPPTTWFSFGGN